ncbi:unnamed protein product [Rhodiola kirilowii]
MQQVWREKQKKEVSFVAFSSSSHMRKEQWYFDSGCSAHMTGNPNHLVHIKPLDNSRFVTFGDVGKGQMIDYGTLKVPKLEDVLRVDGLKVNLISVSQISSNNCYLLRTVGAVSETTCLVSHTYEMELWHRRLGHINLKTLKKVFIEGLIRGLPRVEGDLDEVYGECQIGKQMKATHQKTNQINTNRPIFHARVYGNVVLLIQNQTADQPYLQQVAQPICTSIPHQAGERRAVKV